MTGSANGPTPGRGKTDAADPGGAGERDTDMTPAHDHASRKLSVVGTGMRWSRLTHSDGQEPLVLTPAMASETLAGIARFLQNVLSGAPGESSAQRGHGRGSAGTIEE